MRDTTKKFALYTRRILRKVFRVADTFEATYKYSDYSHQAASDIIRMGLESDTPFAVSRFGHSELRALLNYMHVHEKASEWEKLWNYIRGAKVEPWWSENSLWKVTYKAGFFPMEIPQVEKFCQLVLNDMAQIDVVGSWLGGERWIKPLMTHSKFIRFHDFYHFANKDPWTRALKGKKVLVIHPFAKSIEKQFKIKDKIYDGVYQLPDFELTTYKAVQSIAWNKPSGFENWFEAFEKMKTDIASIDFDVAILACGAYGMPLAAFIKRDLKKKAIHLGGNTQMLFGVKGTRWETDPTFNYLINSHWVKPLAEETPEGHQNIDANSYW